MPVSSENSILYAYRHKGTGNIVTELFQSKAAATSSIRSSLEYGYGVFWKDIIERIKLQEAEAGTDYDNMTPDERIKVRLDYIKHNFTVVTFRPQEFVG